MKPELSRSTSKTIGALRQWFSLGRSARPDAHGAEGCVARRRVGPPEGSQLTQWQDTDWADTVGSAHHDEDGSGGGAQD